MEVEQGVAKMAYRLPELKEMFQVSKPSIYRWMKNDGFPQPVKIGALAFWPVTEVQLWWQDKIVMER
jgi:predicted DNA-binding transcriptional regulator AlpA